MAAAPTATAAPATNGTEAPAAPQAATVIPFVRGSGKGKYKFFSQSSLTLTTASQDLGPIDVKAYDYMRSILVTVTTTTMAAPQAPHRRTRRSTSSPTWQ
jgi:hypothetical protein